MAKKRSLAARARRFFKHRYAVALIPAAMVAVATPWLLHWVGPEGNAPNSTDPVADNARNVRVTSYGPSPRGRANQQAAATGTERTGPARPAFTRPAPVSGTDRREDPPPRPDPPRAPTAGVTVNENYGVVANSVNNVQVNNYDRTHGS